VSTPIVLPVGFGSRNVSPLRPLVSAAEQQNQVAASLSEVYSIARSKIDAQLGHAAAYWSTIAEIPELNSAKASPHNGPSLKVFQGVQPLRKRSLSGRRHVDFQLSWCRRHCQHCRLSAANCARAQKALGFSPEEARRTAASRWESTGW